MKIYLIYAPPYDEISGGAVCLHYLCHLLNAAGKEAWIVPFFEKKSQPRPSIFGKMHEAIRERRRIKKDFKTYSLYNTPVLKEFEIVTKRDDCCVVYPEIVNDNPLNAKNVVRWLLHNPGFHTGQVSYGVGEIYFKFNDALENFSAPGSRLAKSTLKVIRYPLEHYNLEGTNEKNRTGVAYCLRKGAEKAKGFDNKEWILIDGLSHHETSNILKKVRTFYSYDTLTAYSIFAALCGCDSIVVPDMGVTEDEWYPNPADRYGIAYGLENLEKARSTHNLLLPRVEEEHEKNFRNVELFTQEVDEFFANLLKIPHNNTMS